ncbi:MAG TPA: 3-hydroxyacyl-CoA dehydrogenase NAD-binding domain-containing protein [Chthoniobacterales bacterium]|jgi:3-hydroxyacyl-CoA dehydrogenase/enoyl-CoA hydratase/3-hydroxybutyryl-CoA epimerase|nr:3-hydroxyacyl-CoA dehydrogenase NAD-binding domain-containing protein [Chthoniobacterales bacterium]
MPAVATRSLIQREIDTDRVCLLTFDRPESGANIFDAATMSELSEHVDAIEGDQSLRGLIITSAKKSIFIAGADLKTLLKQAQTGELRAFIAEGQRVFNRIAALKIPSVAAIHGACAGGGYEITLACDWRVASDDPATRIGLPETTLGLIPAWGGSTRLPRLIGEDNAAEVILKGKLYSAKEALKIGLVDEVVAREQLLDAARRLIGKRKRPSPKISPSKGKTSAPSDSKSARARALGVITTGGANPIDESLKLELDAIVDLGKTESTQNLIRNFFLAEKYKKGTSKTQFEKVQHAAVIGAGVMGSGIAQWLSSRGVTVILRDVNRELLDRGLANIEKTYADAVKRGLMTEEKAKQGRARIVASTAPMELRDVRFVIEAASEKIDIKKEIFRELSMQAGPKTIIATNTSALPVSELAHCTVSPDRVIGLHFFNPVSRMKLVEVVVAGETSDNTEEQTLAFVRQIGKLPVVVRDSPGFLVNRVLFPYLIDAAELFEAGVEAEKIDSAMVEWGMPMGPLRLIDEIGIDVTVDIAATLEKAYGRRDRTPEILQRMRESKLLGRKSGGGFYKYEGREQSPNPPPPGTGSAAASESLAKTDLAQRLMFLMINEAARCIEEKVVASPEDADYGMILGTGFAPHRGGPLRFAEHFGLKKIVEEMGRLAQSDDKFQPCDILQKHARDGTKFYES